MSRDNDLQKAERKVFISTLQDGLLEIMISALVLMWAISPLLSIHLGDFWSSAIFLPFWGLIFLGIRLIRKYVILPRTGKVKFGTARNTKLLRFSLIMVVVNLIFFILGLIAVFWIVPSGNEQSDWSINLIFGLTWLLLGSLAGLILGLPRLIVYGLMLAAAPIVGEWLRVEHGATHHGYPITFGIATGVIFLTGIILFVRFFRNCPLPPENIMEGKA